MGQRGELFSTRTTTQRRTYFFNVKENRHGNVFLNLVESKRSDGSEQGTSSLREFERHSVIVFEEDMAEFVKAFDQAVAYVRKRQAAAPRAPRPRPPRPPAPSGETHGGAGRQRRPS